MSDASDKQEAQPVSEATGSMGVVEHGAGRSIKQFLFLRKDLEGYTMGMLIAQGCHASVAALERYRNTPAVADYFKHLGCMTTIVYGIRGDEMEGIEKSLQKMGIGYHCWVENGNTPTCIATCPIDIEVIKEFKNFRRRFKLFGN